MALDYIYAVASEAELSDVMAGRPVHHPAPWRARHTNARLSPGMTGVLGREPRGAEEPFQPLILVAPRDEHRRLFGRFAQLRSDLSPLTAWCHVITPQRFEALDALVRNAELGAFAAAWAGLVVAESFLLADRSISQLKIAACFATQSFAVARTKALWSQISISEIIERYEAAQKLLRSGEARSTRLRTVLEPIWTSLGALSVADLASVNNEIKPLVQSLRALADARTAKDPSESVRLSEPLRNIVDDIEMFEALPNLTPERRVQAFDQLVGDVEKAAQASSTVRRHAFALLAGYLATVAAGGAPSLSLAEANSQRWPEITAWAYLIGGIGERVIWTSSFDGLGRLVARELMRPLRLEDSPACDFALDEGLVLFDPQLPDPLVHLRIKQSRVATVSLYPGVNVSVPITGEMIPEARSPESDHDRVRPDRNVANRLTSDALGMLADALWPYLRDRMEGRSGGQTAGSWYNRQKRGKGKRETAQTKLPLKG
jgi:hypothetical protein